ncbi:MAG: ATP-binding protein [Rubricoccaceae bacterium]
MRTAALLALLLLAGTARAQAPGGRGWDRAPVPLGVALDDADGDFVPDRLGDSLRVAGRVTAGTGLLRTDVGEVYLQDGTGGIRLVLPPGAPAVRAGDSLDVLGVLAHRHGMAEFVAPAFRVVRAPHAIPAPHRLSDSAALEQHRGELVELRGTVLATERTEAGALMLLLVGKRLVQVFAYHAHPQSFSFEAFEPGSYVRVRGVLTRHDPGQPYNGSYMLLPRFADDVARAGVPPAYYRYGLGTGLLLLVLAGAWVGLLRRGVRSKAAQLQQSESRYAQLFNAVADAVLVHDSGTLTAVNHAASRLFALDAYGLPIVNHVVPPGATSVPLERLAAHPGAIREHLEVARAQGQAQDVIELRTAEGRVVPFEFITRRPRDADAGTLISVARDAEARVAYEHALLEAMRASEVAREEAEDAARLKSAILANMSHEIRTPLTAILGFADILAEEVPDDLRDCAETIRSGGQRLLDTLNSILDYARLDAGHEHLVPEPTDAVACVGETVALLQPLAQRKGLALAFVPDAPAIPVRHAPVGLQRVASNLIGNAIKFTERGGVRVTLHSAPTFFALRVHDTGVGIAEEFLPQLFEAFSQESDGHARAFEGTGLGLAITRGLVHLMGGEIRVWSRKGEGTLFEVALPREGPDPDAPAPGAAGTSAGDGQAHAALPRPHLAGSPRASQVVT